MLRGPRFNGTSVATSIREGVASGDPDSESVPKDRNTAEKLNAEVAEDESFTRVVAAAEAFFGRSYGPDLMIGMCAGNILMGIVARCVERPTRPGIGDMRPPLRALQLWETGKLDRVHLSFAVGDTRVGLSESRLRTERTGNA